MQELKTLMESSYRGHPAFSFGVPSWDVPVEKLAVFNETYEAARQFGSTLGAASRAALRQDLLQALDAVFASFQVQ